MDFKKLFRKNDKAVSPVIGVILMVAITVILAAAIGSSVFSQGTTKSAPQANFNIKADKIVANGSTATDASIIIEHLGGSTIHFEDSKATLTASVNGANSVKIDATGLGEVNAGDVKNLKLIQISDGKPLTVAKGNTVNIKISDAQTNQIVCDRDIKFL